MFEGTVTGDRNSANTAMNMTLRPGEALVWRWGHLNPIKYHGSRPPRFPDRLCNGSWEYRPDFKQPSWRAGATTVESIRERDDGLMAEEGKTGIVVWTMSSPYVFVGGRLEVEGTGAKFKLSWDGKSWHEVDRNLDGLFPPEGPARYRYYLKCELSGDARLRRLAIVNDLQMAPLTLPGMGVGTNAFTYTDESASSRRVRITHQWVERSASRPPDAPAEPVFPPSGGVTDGTEIVFQWRPASDPDGDAIADYHFELSERADMKWPLSMSFAKLISRTADAGQARYTLPGPGLLNPDTEYFWRVRAQDDKGVWGPWSPTWSFTPRGPAPPRDVSLEFDRERNRGVLRWAPNPLGRKPVAYRVYASDEKGFSVSDRPYKVTVGVSDKMPSEFPANFVVETSATELEVVGAQVKLAGANKAFYRVVAVDAAGNRSGPSDYAAVPAAGHRQRACDPSQERRRLSLSGRGHPIAGRSQDAGRQWQGNNELLGRRTASIRHPAGPAMAHDRRSDRSAVGDARSTGHDRGGCLRDARTRRPPPGRGGSQVGNREGRLLRHGDGRQRHSELRHRGGSVAKPELS